MKIAGGHVKLFNGRKEPHTLAGAYATDALDPGDRARFERHLARCDSCAQEVSELRETAARLAVASAVPPPPAMKERVISAVHETRQHAPGTAPEKQRRVVLIAAPAAVLLIGALIAVATVFGLANSDTSQRLSQAQQRDETVAAVLTAKDATMMSGPVTGGGMARVVMSHEKQALVFMAAGLPTLPASAGYELWLIGPAGDRPAGMLPASVHGMTGPVIATGLRGGDQLMLSVEPAAGTMHPTTRMMLDIRL